jgi:hypothetical protein
MKALAFVALAGCATMFGGGPDAVPIQTQPSGASIYINGHVVGQTPMVLGLDRGSPALIELYAPGYRPVTIQLKKSINGWFIANVVWFYLIVPWIVDVVMGNWQAYDDNVVLVPLQPAQNDVPPLWYRQVTP